MVKKILFVEDDEALSKAYLRAFGSEYSCKTIETGQEGIDVIRSWTPDLVVLDLMIPGKLSGYDVLEILKNDEKLKSIPVIVATNLSDQAVKVLQMGAARCLVKSDLSVDELRDVINSTV